MSPSKVLNWKDNFFKQEKRTFNYETLQWQRKALWFWGDRVRCRKLVDTLQKIWPIPKQYYGKKHLQTWSYTKEVIKNASPTTKPVCALFSFVQLLSLWEGMLPSLFLTLYKWLPQPNHFMLFRIIITGLKKLGSLHRSQEESVSSICENGVISFISRILECSVHLINNKHKI